MTEKTYEIVEALNFLPPGHPRYKAPDFGPHCVEIYETSLCWENVADVCSRSPENPEIWTLIFSAGRPMTINLPFDVVREKIRENFKKAQDRFFEHSNLVNDKLILIAEKLSRRIIKESTKSFSRRTRTNKK